VHELPLPVDPQRLQVIVRVAAYIARRSVSHFKVDNLFPGFVDQPVAVARTRPEPGTHARRELGSTFVSVKRRVPLEDVDELVLPGVSVAQRRRRPGHKPRQIHAEVGETEQVTQRLFSPARHSGREGLRIVRRLRSWRCFVRDDGNRVCWSGHTTLVVDVYEG